MNIYDYIIIAALLVWAAVSVIYICVSRRKGCPGCSGCAPARRRACGKCGKRR